MLDRSRALPCQVLFFERGIVQCNDAVVFEMTVWIAWLVAEEVVSEVHSSLVERSRNPRCPASVDPGDQYWMHWFV